MKWPAERTILAVYACADGIGYVLFESPLSIVDWGVKAFRGEGKNVASTNAVAYLLESYAPDVLVLDDTLRDTSRRTKRIRSLYRMLEGVALTNGVHVERVDKDAVNSCFEKLGARTKYERATVIANHLPALFHRLPRERRIWQSEDPKMAMFQAASLGFAAYAQHD